MHKKEKFDSVVGLKAVAVTASELRFLFRTWGYLRELKFTQQVSFWHEGEKVSPPWSDDKQRSEYVGNGNDLNIWASYAKDLIKKAQVMLPESKTPQDLIAHYHSLKQDWKLPRNPHNSESE